MGALKCEVCGGKLIGKPGGIFECEFCGVEYSTEWAKEKIQEIRGTVKVEGTVEVTGKVQVEGGSVNVEGAATKESLLKRAKILIEESNYKDATPIIEEALKIDPENGYAYLLKDMARLHINNIEEAAKYFANHKKCASDNIFKYKTEEMESFLTLYEAEANRLENARLELEQKRTAGAEKRRKLRELFAQPACEKRIVYGENSIVILDSKGTVHVSTEKDYLKPAEGWTDIIEIIGWEYVVFGLTRNGTVLSTSDNIQNKLKSWEYIHHIFCRGNTIFGIRSDGTVLCYYDFGGNDENKREVESWKDITFICGSRPTLGLKADGTVVAAANHIPVEPYIEHIKKANMETNRIIDLQSDVTNWCDIKKIFMFPRGAVGIKKDGTLEVSGNGNGMLKKTLLNAKNVISVREQNILCSDGKIIGRYNGDDYVGIAEYSHESYQESIALHENGSVEVLFQSDDYTKTWENIIAVGCLAYGPIAITAEGNVISKNGLITSDWKMFDNEDDMEQSIKQAEADRKNIAVAYENYRLKYIDELQSELSGIKQEYASLKGPFNGKRKKEIELRIKEIDGELLKLNQ